MQARGESWQGNLREVRHGAINVRSATEAQQM